MSNNIKGATPVFFDVFHPQLVKKRLPVDAKAPVFSRSMTHQTKEKGLPKVNI
jgi:hypothetical protein